jgi:hypothetical protein
VARDNFSEWLAPHESPTTDVILVGHSMGGILAADVVLMVRSTPMSDQDTDDTFEKLWQALTCTYIAES